MEFLKQKRKLFHNLIRQEVTSFWSTNNLKKQTSVSGLKDILGYVNPALRVPSYYIFEAESKKLRPILGCLIMNALGVKNAERFEKYLILPELLHSASLIIDDIEDGAAMRRNRLCLHIKYGIDTAVNIANALYFLPFYFLKKSEIRAKYKLRIYDILTESMNRMHIGQGLDILWHKRPSLPISPSHYLLMARLKTSSFFRAEAELAVLFSGVRGAIAEKAVLFAENIGVAFQIIDDVLDLTIAEKELDNFGKKFAQDITEGKKTLIVSYALQRATPPERKKLLQILGLHTRRKTILEQAIGILKKYKCIEDAEKYAYKLIFDSWDAFSKLLKPSEAKGYLDLYCRFIVERRF